MASKTKKKAVKKSAPKKPISKAKKIAAKKAVSKKAKPAKKVAKPARAKAVVKSKAKAKAKPAKAKPAVKAKPAKLPKKAAAKVKEKVKKAAVAKETTKVKIAKLPEKSATSAIKHVEKPVERSRRRTGPPIVKPAAPARTTPLREDPVLPDAPVASILKKPVAILDNRPAKLENSPDKTRYSDEELQEFRDLIIQKITDAKVELNNLQAFLNNSNEHGTDDTASSFKMLEDGSDTLAKEEAGQLAVRQRKFIEQLENALVRIENKTYGICRVTGKLIPKERLRAVPHTTQSIEAKVKQYRD